MQKDIIDYDKLTKKYPWIIEKGHSCILSPDSDGLLCGLFMSHYLDWKIKGYYDGKVILVDKNTSIKDCIFIDMDIFRKDIRSIGHHMVLYNTNRMPANWVNFENCIQPNNMRKYDGYHNFRLKYPLATIHLIVAILGQHIKVDIPDSAICPLLYTDGVFKNLLGYPENCIDWLSYLGADKKSNILHTIFLNDYYSIHNLMLALNDFFEKIYKISKKKKGNDKIRISNSKGEGINITENNKTFLINTDEKNKSEQFINILSGLTKWDYNPQNWQWDNFQLKILNKMNIKPNNRNYEKMLSENPISWAMTSGQAIEYTLDERKILFK